MELNENLEPSWERERIENLKLDENAYRKETLNEIRNLTTRFGQVLPVVVDAAGRALGENSNATLKAILERNETEVWIVRYGGPHPRELAAALDGLKATDVDLEWLEEPDEDWADEEEVPFA